MNYRIGLNVDSKVYKEFKKIAALREIPVNHFINALMMREIKNENALSDRLKAGKVK